MNASDYFYRDKEGREIGPFSLDALVKFRMAEVVGPETLVRTADSTAWRPLREVISESARSTVNPTKKPSWPIGIVVAAVIIGLLWYNGREKKNSSSIEPIQTKLNELTAKAISAPRTQKYICWQNLRQIEGATEQWALEEKKRRVDAVSMTDLVRFFKNTPRCPAGGTYKLYRVETRPECTVSGHTIELSAEELHEAKAEQEARHKVEHEAKEARYARMTDEEKENTCIANLKQIEGATEQWALEKKKNRVAAVSMTDLVLGGYIKYTPRCPAGGTYKLNRLDTRPECTVAGHVLP